MPGQVEDLTAFLHRATGTRSQAQAPVVAAGPFPWCWHVPAPKPPVTGEVYPQVFIDGLWLGSWVLLVARSPTHVITWQQAVSEDRAAYQGLLADLVTTDGAAGALKAITTWPHTPVQRCLVHAHRHTARDLTRHPKTTPGQTLPDLSHKLLTISHPALQPPTRPPPG